MFLTAASSTFGLFPVPPPSRSSKPLTPTLNLNQTPHLNSSGLNGSATNSRKRLCEVYDLHKELVPYGQAWDLQKRIVKDKKALIQQNKEFPDGVIVLQHRPVYTMGTGSSLEYLNFDVKDSPYELYRTERGGEVTYHGPGQLVMYPILDLRQHKMDLHWYLRALEEVVIRVLSSTFSIKATRAQGLTGVWVGDQKLAAIGIKVSQWITYHGLSLNVTSDLKPFNRIVPCGIKNRKVGSIKGLLGEVQLSGDGANADREHLNDQQLIELAYQALINQFCDVFQLQLYEINLPVEVNLGK